MKYLVVRCVELGDQWECDADRRPVCLTEDYSKYDKQGYEIYKLNKDNTFTLVRNYEDVTKEEMVVAIWKNVNHCENKPSKYITICGGDRDYVTSSTIEKVKKTYHFADSIEDIESDISCSGYHGEEINGKWVVFGEKFDDYISKGF